MHARAGLVLVVALAGCTRHNPFFCNDPNNATAPECAGDAGSDGAGMACTGPADCTVAGLMVCDTSTTPGTCVQCTDGASGDHTACTATTPFCANDTCRGCRTDDECLDSHFCELATGACAAPGSVLYVAPAGSGTACTVNAPCLHLSDAINNLDGNHARVHMDSGSYTELDTVTIQHNVTVHGNDAVLRSNANGDVFVVSDNGAAVTVTFIDFHESSLNGAAFVCTRTTNAVSLRLGNVELHDNSDKGVDSSRCDLVIDRGNIHDNIGGGIAINDGSLKVTNTIIAANGQPNTNLGGVRITNVAAGANQFALDTVVGNHSNTNSVAAGIACALNAPIALSSNIVFGNDDPATQLSEDNGCTSSYTMSDQMLLQGTHNLMDDPLLTSTNHLGPTSPAIDQGDPALTLDHDFDGEPRPQGGGYDIGADEAK